MTLYSIAADQPFLPTLAQALFEGPLLADWPRTGPFWLSDVTVIVPTQRARQALAAEIAAHPASNGLLPDIRTFGGEVPDEEPFLPPFEAPPLPKPVTTLRRRLVLSRLVAAWAGSPEGRAAFSTPPSAAEIFSMSESLAQLIDDLLIEEQDAATIKTLGADLGSDIGAYWQQTLKFLDIALSAWPEILSARGLADPAALRRARLDRQALGAPILFADRPVIAAGSTGSIPATARLLSAIARLPRGAVVLPGFDMDMDDADHAALLDSKHNPHGHPQYGLAQLLRRLGSAPAEVAPLGPDPGRRAQLVNLALALPAATATWPEQRLAPADLDAALAGVAIMRARNEDEEARAIALAARSALAEHRTVGIVTPDRNLARRIAAELARFGIRVDDAAGSPLFQAPSGRLARQVLKFVTGKCGAVDLVALLRNPACLLGHVRADIMRLADAIELRLLRGRRLSPGLEGLREALNYIPPEGQKPRRAPLSAAEREKITHLIDRLATVVAPLDTVLSESRIDGASLATALWQAVEQIADGAELPGRAEMQLWAEELFGLVGEGHTFPPIGLDAVLATLMAGTEVRNHRPRRSDIAIWGQLEARLMSPDLLILAALNEDIWPAAADPGPWLSRGMRLAAGLEPPERMQGLAAHDFAQAMGNGNVLVAYADRVGTGPSLPSRLVQRLDAFIGTDWADRLRRGGQRWLDEARRIDLVEAVVPATRPAPNPPVSERPRQISVTEVETLMRSPYDLYAKYVLRLRPLDPLGEEPDARERGTIIHAIFARFVAEGHDPAADTALETLLSMADAAFTGLDAIAERRDIWLRRFATAAEQFIAFERARAGSVAKRHAEVDGRWTLKLGDGFAIIGRADRVDLLRDGSLEILDFKTGAPPTPVSMKGFEAPQLLVEALMGQAGGLETIAPASSSALTYIKIGLGPDAFKPTPFSLGEDWTLMEAAEEIGRRLQGHVDLFLFHETPMHARLLPFKGQRFAGTYDHLARVAEWTAVDDGEGEP